MSIDPDNIREHVFFLTYYGKGYTLQDCWNLYFDELVDHVKKLKKQLDAENQAHRAAAEKAKAQSRRGRR